MDYRRNDSYYRRGRSPVRGRYHGGKSRSRERSYSPQGRRNYSRDRRDRSPQRYSSSWRVGSSGRRSRSRSCDRSRSGSRRRYSSRRSGSRDSYGRYRRDSSSSEERRSNSKGTRVPHIDEAHNTMYADRESQNTNDGPVPMYAAQSGNQAPDVAGAPRTTNIEGNGQAAKPSDFTAISRGYDGREMEDEDRFLYGDDGDLGQRPLQNPPQKPEVAVEPETKDDTVTPGGFDSNALKNVLKAIGFDFEMSAQQIQDTIGKSVTKKPEPTPPPKKPVAQPPQSPKKPPPEVEKPQKIQTIQSGHISNVTVPEKQTQQYYQAYDPYNPTANSQYHPPHPATIPTSQPLPSMIYQNQAPSSLGYPMAIPDPNNPGGTLLVYQPLNQPVTTQQTMYHQAEQMVSQSLAHGGRIVLPPQRTEESKPDAPPVNDERQERLNYLQEELEKLKKQQNELMDKKKKEPSGGNSDHSQAAERDLNSVRQAVETAAGIRSDSDDDSVQGQKDEKCQKYDYVDPGSHWCRLCNSFCPDLMAFLSHLHSKAHRKAIDPYDRPWDDKEKVKKTKSAHMKMKSLKGVEFLIPITGYYCTLCQTFSGDQICGDEHLKSHAHNEIYKKHCKKNPSYEKKYKKKKKAAMEEIASEENKNGEMDEIVKKSKSKSEKKEKWIEKIPKTEPSSVPLEPIFPEFKPYPSDKMAYNFDSKAQVINESIQKQSRTTERHAMECNRVEPRQERIEPKEERKRNFVESTRHDESNRKREREKERIDRPSDHGKRKRSWSPGYDEYERQQQQRDDQNREGYRSDNRIRSGRWEEKSSEQGRKKESFGKQNESVKKMPGFGKFTWSSGTVRSSRRLEPAPSNAGSSLSAFNQSSEDSKGKIAIKFTGRNRLSTSKEPSKSSYSESEKKAVVDDLKKKVEALKRENALRNQLSSITLPSKGSSRQPRPNTAAALLGTRSIGKHNTLLHAKSLKLAKDRKEPEQNPMQEIEADVSPPPPPTEIKVKPPPPREYEPPPPGEEDMDFGVDDDARSDVSGISMELASDEG